MPPEPSDIGYEESSYPESRSSRPSEASPILSIVLSILKRPWLTVIALIMLVTPVLFYVYTRPLVYRSQSLISTVRSPVARGISAGGYNSVNPLDPGDEQFYASVLESGSYFDQIAVAILAERPEFETASDSLNALIRSNVTYSRKPRTTGFYYITATAGTPEFAFLLAEKSLSSFEQISSNLRRQEATVAAEFIEHQLVEANRGLEEVESKIQAFLRDRGLNIDQASTGIDGELRELQRSLVAAQIGRDLARLQIDSYSAKINQRVNQYIGQNTDDGNQARLQILRKELNELNLADQDSISNLDSVRFKSYQDRRQEIIRELLNATRMTEARQSVNTEENAISLEILENQLGRVFVEYESAHIRFNYFNAAIDLFIQEHPNFPNDVLDYYNLTRLKTVYLKTVDLMVEMRERTRIQMASETGGITVIDNPNIPSSPLAQNRASKILIAVLIALLLGVSVSYAIDLLDNTVQSESDIQNRFNLPVYGSIPVLDEKSKTSRKLRHSHHRNKDAQPIELKDDKKHLDYKLLDRYGETSPVAEAYHSIKTAILFTARDRKKKTFVVTSPVASDGKSLTTYNLAVSFAQGGLRTLVVDADLRRASQHKLFITDREPGLTDVLHAKKTVQEAVIPGPVKNLSFLPAGMRISNPAELLSSNLMAEFVKEVEADYDMILIDTPPITPCMDSRHLALMTGGMILVVRAEGTKLNVLEHSLNLCNRVNVEVLGVIINHAAFRYGYGYYYLYQRYNPYGYYYSGYQYYYSQDPDTGDKVRKKKRKSHANSYEYGE